MAEHKCPMRSNPQGGNDFRTTRSIQCAGIRAVEGEGNERKFELSFSSEDPVLRWYGLEILDHSDGCMDMSRLQEMGVVLFNHKTDKVVGKVVRAWVEDHRGKAEIEFDDDEEAETIRKKVASGTLKGVSVGYAVDKWEEVAKGKKSTDGRFLGPCYIATRWRPMEISIVAVPADATVGVGRSEEDEGPKPESSLETYRMLLQINENRMLAKYHN